MNRQEQKRRFAQAMILLSVKYNVELKIDWDNGVLDFNGNPPAGTWTKLVNELTQISREWNAQEV